MNEIERATYAGLTISDKPALLDAKARGAEWVARDTNNDLYGYAVEPIDDIDYGWTTPFIGNVITINAESMKFVALHEKINIDLALAQIAEMESKPIDESATDDIVLAEVYSLREKLKIAADIIHKLDPNYDVTEFLHQVGSADYDQREEDLAPLTWNERINQMTVEEKAKWIRGFIGCESCPLPLCDKDCVEMWKWFFNSPYTEGETK